MARAIRRLSGRRARGYQAINCEDFTPEVLRSELFGHERGAFTGAVGKKEGLLPHVDGGTVFLDEIGELSPLAQSMLLRFLQTGEGLAVGATRSMRLDVRVIAATHRNLEAAVVGGTFREDFYYRLLGAVLRVPPLRTRPEDIPLVVEHFRLKFNSDDQLAVDGFTRQALALLEADSWPGNVRELERVVHRAVTVWRRGRVEVGDVEFPELRRQAPAAAAPEPAEAPPAVPAPATAGVVSAPLSRHQAEAFRMASAGGEVRRGDLMARCGISRDRARRTLASLVERGLLRRLGSGRGAWYVLRGPEGAGG